MKKLIPLVLVSFVLILAFYLVVKAQVKNEVPNSSSSPVKSYSAKVVKVVDGDTLILSNGEKIRLIGVDTPEIAHPLKPIQYFAKEAGSFTKKMVEGKKVRLEFDRQERGKYDRLLAYVYLKDGTFLNAEIIKQGYGFAYTKFPFKYLEEFKQHEKEAEKNKRGLWRGGGEVELDWLERKGKEPFELYKMANDLWGIKFGMFVKTRISNNELVPILREAEALANECHEKDLEMELLRRGWKKE